MDSLHRHYSDPRSRLVDNSNKPGLRLSPWPNRFGRTGGIALERQSAFEEANDGSDPAAATEIRDEGQTLNVVTDVFLGLTIASGAAATLFWILWGLDDDDEVSQPWIAPSGAGVVGRF